MILAGDIGGTHTRLALFEEKGGLVPVRSGVFPSREQPDLASIVRSFLAGAPGPVLRACFGIAGVVRGGRAAATNLPWKVDGSALAAELSIGKVALLNDLAAAGWAVEVLSSAAVAVLSEGEPDPSGNGAVIAAGTGLGEAGLAWDGRRRRPFASEGGHADFAPADERQEELLRFLRAELGHVSWERVCSGMGLVNIERFLRARAGEPEPAWAAQGDAAAIARRALEDTDVVSAQALEMMVEIYGAQAGNLALAAMATGGVYLGGGIAPKILPRLRDGGFLHAFTAKGRFATLLARIPVRVILDDLTALRGAARRAAAG